MRVFGHFLALVCACGIALGAVEQTPAERADKVLADARAALGGDKLAALKSLTANGRTQRVRGNNLVPIEFEIFLQLPDKYLRADESPFEETDPTSSGFNGSTLIQFPAAPAAPAMPAGPMAGRPAPAAPAAGAPPAGAPPAGAPPAGAAPGGRPMMDPNQRRVSTLKQDFARLWLGLFASSPSAYPLTFSWAAVAEAPQGLADVLDAKGEGAFTLRLFVDSKTKLPLMVSWSQPPTSVIITVPGQPATKTVAPGAVVVAGPPAPAAGAPKEEADKYSKDVIALRAKAQATPVEHRLYFADYREVDGIKFPFRLRRAIGTETTEETTFDRFRVNPKIDPRKFEPVK